MSRAAAFGFIVSIGLAFVASPAGATTRSDVEALNRVVATPFVVATAVSNRSVPDTGGLVHFTVRVRGAEACTLRVAGDSAVAVAFSRAWTRCSNGIFRHTVRVGANTAQTRQTIGFRVYLRRNSRMYRYSLGAVSVDGASSLVRTLQPTASLTISENSLSSAGGTLTFTYSSSGASSCSLSSSPPFWAGNNPTPVSCNGTYRPTVSASSVDQLWTFTFTAANASDQSATSTQTLEEAAADPSFAPSENWSGYVVPSGGPVLTYASGEWTVPNLNCTDTPNAGASFWVGIGGAEPGAGDLLQTGIRTDCVNGVQQNAGWWEEAPELPEIDFAGTYFPVSAGDSIQAEVFSLPNGCTANCEWETRIDDFTTGLSGTMITGEGWGVAPSRGGSYLYLDTTPSATYSGGTTAEWIVEDYKSGNSFVPFANFGTVSFGDLMLGGVSPWQLDSSEGTEIVQNGVALSTPTAPGSDGFSVSYTGP